MNPMYRKCNPPVFKSADFKIEPAFGVALVVGGCSVASRPDTIMIEVISLDSHQIPRIKLAIEENIVLFGL